MPLVRGFDSEAKIIKTPPLDDSSRTSSFKRTSRYKDIENTIKCRYAMEFAIIIKIHTVQASGIQIPFSGLPDSVFVRRRFKLKCFFKF